MCRYICFRCNAAEADQHVDSDTAQYDGNARVQHPSDSDGQFSAIASSSASASAAAAAAVSLSSNTPMDQHALDDATMQSGSAATTVSSEDALLVQAPPTRAAGALDSATNSRSDTPPWSPRAFVAESASSCTSPAACAIPVEKTPRVTEQGGLTLSQPPPPPPSLSSSSSSSSLSVLPSLLPSSSSSLLPPPPSPLPSASAARLAKLAGSPRRSAHTTTAAAETTPPEYSDPNSLVWQMHEASDADDDAAYMVVPSTPHSAASPTANRVDKSACAALLPSLTRWRFAPRHCHAALLESNFLAAAKRWLEPSRDARRSLPPLTRRTEVLRLLGAMHDLVTLDQIRRTRGLVQTLTEYSVHQDERDGNRMTCR
jgi:hypothetical protein